MPDRRGFLTGSAGMLTSTALFRPTSSGAAAQSSTDYAAYVDPELRPLVAPISAWEAQHTPLTLGVLEDIRSSYLSTALPPLAQPHYIKKVIPSLDGERAVEIYIINPKPDARRAGIVHTHGGGYFMGSPQIDMAHLQAIAAEVDATIISVCYSLAPQSTWRQSTDDTYSALKWLHQNASELGCSPDRLAVMGESAGGGHAALLAIIARDRGEVEITFQCLVYPMLDDRTGNGEAPAYPRGYVGWSSDFNRFGWRSFLGVAPGSSDVPAAAVPARTRDLKGLPPAWIGVGALDLLVDEGITYAHRLIDAAVPTELVVVPGAFHGFDELTRGISPRPKISLQFERNKIDALKKWSGATMS